MDSVRGKAEEAVNFWTSIFPEAKVNVILHFGKGEEPDQEGTLKYGTFSFYHRGLYELIFTRANKLILFEQFSPACINLHAGFLILLVGRREKKGDRNTNKILISSNLEFQFGSQLS